jgi:hypothetical protein
MIIVSSKEKKKKTIHHQDNIFIFRSMNIDHWLLPLPLTDTQENAYKFCQEKLNSLLNLPLRIHCLPNDTLIEQTTLTINNRNPLKMYWQRNLNELRLFLKTHQTKLQANLIEIHKRRRLQITRYVKQDLSSSSVTSSFSQIPTTTNYLLSLIITGKHSILELQIPSIDTDLIYHGTYRKIGEDAQLRPVTILFNCTIDIDNDMAVLLSEYGLCQLNS